MTTPTTNKAERLSYCEQTIAAGKQTFLDVGNALAEIMEEQLYKLKGYGSFAEYCDKEWGFKKTYAYQLVASYKAVEPFSAIAENINEATARELTKVPAEKRPEVLALAGDKPTAAAIRKAHKTTLAKASEPTSRPEPEQPAALKGIDVSKLDGAKVGETDRAEFFANDFESICDAVIADGNDKQLAAAILAAEVAVKKMRQEANRRRSQAIN